VKSKLFLFNFVVFLVDAFACVYVCIQLYCSCCHYAKSGVFSRISQDILDRYSQSFHLMKALRAQMINLDLLFGFVKRRCHGNQVMSGKSNERKLILPESFTLVI